MSVGGGGVSAGVGGELEAVLGTFEEFQERLKTMREAKRNLDDAYNNLNLGRAAVAAHEEAVGIRDKAKRDRDIEFGRLQDEMQRTRNEINGWIEAKRAEAFEKVQTAQDLLRSATERDAIALDNELRAKAVLVDAEKRAAEMLAKAKSEAEAMLDDADRRSKDMLREAEDRRASAHEHERNMLSSRKEFEDKVSRLKDILKS